MKKLSFVFLLFAVLVLAGCGKNNTTIIQQDTSSVDSGSVWTGEFSLCDNEKLSDEQILVMDDIVKNCTEKEKEGKFVDGLGGVYPMYVIANNQILLGSMNNDETGSGIVCQQSDGQKLLPLGANTLQGMDAIKKVIGKGYINQIMGKQYPESMYCNDNDQDCMDMLNYEGWIDGINYFVAGFRINPDGAFKVYYVINDKVYLPGQTETAYGGLAKSAWNFASIKDGKIIVKRIKNTEVIGDPQTMSPQQLKTKFILETCEIDG